MCSLCFHRFKVLFFLLIDGYSIDIEWFRPGKDMILEEDGIDRIGFLELKIPPVSTLGSARNPHFPWIHRTLPQFGHLAKLMRNILQKTWLLCGSFLRSTFLLPLRSIVWYLYLHLVDFYGFHVGKYTSPSPMDASWGPGQIRP